MNKNQFFFSIVMNLEQLILKFIISIQFNDEILNNYKNHKYYF